MLTSDEKAEVLQRIREGKSVQDDGLFDRIVAAHGYGRFECLLHYTGEVPEGEDAYLYCLPRTHIA